MAETITGLRIFINVPEDLSPLESDELFDLLRQKPAKSRTAICTALGLIEATELAELSLESTAVTIDESIRDRSWAPSPHIRNSVLQNKSSDDPELHFFAQHASIKARLILYLTPRTERIKKIRPLNHCWSKLIKIFDGLDVHLQIKAWIDLMEMQASTIQELNNASQRKRKKTPTKTSYGGGRPTKKHCEQAPSLPIQHKQTPDLPFVPDQTNLTVQASLPQEDMFRWGADLPPPRYTEPNQPCYQDQQDQQDFIVHRQLPPLQVQHNILYHGQPQYSHPPLQPHLQLQQQQQQQQGQQEMPQPQQPEQQLLEIAGWHQIGQDYVGHFLE